MLMLHRTVYFIPAIMPKTCLKPGSKTPFQLIGKVCRDLKMVVKTSCAWTVRVKTSRNLPPDDHSWEMLVEQHK